MKISRIFLSAMILFSMQSSLFGMRPSIDDKDVVVVEEQTHVDMPTIDDHDVVIVATQTLVRRKSHDGTRDGKFGSAQDTFSKLGNSYNPLFGTQNQVYDIGSDEQAPARWTPFAAQIGDTITSINDLKKWESTITRKEQECPSVDWTPLQESKIKAQKLIATDRHDRFKQCNTQITRILLAVHDRTTQHNKDIRTSSIALEKKIFDVVSSLRSRHKADVAAQKKALEEELSELQISIQSEAKIARNIKSDFNSTQPSNPITHKLLIPYKVIQQLDHAQLVKIAAATAAKTKSCC